MLSVSGCRGIVGRSLTPEVVARFAAAFARWVGQGGASARPRIVVGRDGRQGGDAIARCAIASLAAAGCDVVDIGVATTPTVGLMVREIGAQGGLSITASHNPAEWNGLKPITSEGRAPAKRDAEALIAAIRSPDPIPTATPGEMGEAAPDASAGDRHVASVLSAIERVCPIDTIKAKRFRVALDSVNASGARVGARLLEALGCELTHLHAEESGVFPHTPEPTRENLKGLCEAVRTMGAQAAFAQDPDADRLAIIDGSGAYLGEEYTLVIAAMSLLSAMPKEEAARATVVANLSTSRMIDDVAATFGARVVRAAVGEANVVEAMSANGSVLAGEGNGGVIWPEVVPIRDSLVAMALTLALLARDGRTLGEIVADVPRYAIVKRKLDIAPGMADAAMSATERAFPGAAIDRQDGVRADFAVEEGRAWVHVRPSNTEPILRLIAEAPSEAAANEALDRVQGAIA